MKRYRVVLHPDAEAELEETYLFIFNDSPANAAKWRRGLLKKARSLNTFPNRCPLAPESGALGEDVRQLLHGAHRLLFVVDEDVVTILHVRHGARQPLGRDDDS
jgi:plasmid stabilization system protein ParE